MVPKFAVITLEDGIDIACLNSLLLSVGCTNVMFLENLEEYFNKTVPQSIAISDHISSSCSGEISSDNVCKATAATATAIILRSSDPDNVSLYSDFDRYNPFDNSGAPLSKRGIEEISVWSDTSHTNSLVIPSSDSGILSLSDESRIINENLKTKIRYSNSSSVELECQLCGNRVSKNSRWWNLARHASSHIKVKSFKCVGCKYQKDDRQTVRHHMVMVHGQDFTSTDPINNNCPELKELRKVLTALCFPRARTDWQVPYTLPNLDMLLKLQKDNNITRHRCIDCHVRYVSIRNDMISEEASSLFVLHLIDKHSSECVLFKCSKCGYRSIDKNNIFMHISEEHRILALTEGIFISQTYAVAESYSDMLLFIPKYFPTAEQFLGLNYMDEVEQVTSGQLEESESLSINIENIARSMLFKNISDEVLTVTPSAPVQSPTEDNVLEKLRGKESTLTIGRHSNFEEHIEPSEKKSRF